MKLCWINLFVLITIPAVVPSENEVCGGGEFTITEECHFCSDHELEAYDECKHTQYVEKLKCKSGDIKWKSCNGREADQVRSFWHFEVAMIVTSVVSGIVVMLRMRKLDRENTERIQRQISAL